MAKMKKVLALVAAAAMAVSFAGADGSVVSAKKVSSQKTKEATKKAKTFKIKKNMVLTDKTVDKLPKVMASKKVKSITLKLNTTGELTIGAGDFSTKKLTVNAVNTNIVNNATFDEIDVEAAGIFNEKGNANNIEINSDKDSHVVVDTERRVSSITYGKEAGGANSVEIKDGALANVVVNSTSSVGLSASGDASIGAVYIEGAGANVSINAADKSRVNRLSIGSEAASAYTYVSVVAAGAAVIKNIVTAARDAILSVTANDNAHVNSIKAIGKTNVVVSGTSVKSINIDVTGMESGSSVVVNNSHVKVEKTKDQNISDLISNNTGTRVNVEDRRAPGEAPAGNDASTSIGTGWSSGGSGSTGGSGFASSLKGINRWNTGKTAYVDSAKDHIIEENLEELVNLPAGTSNLKGKDLVVSIKVKNAACSKEDTKPQVNLAVMSDNWENWYGEDWQGITLQEEEKEYKLKLSFDKYHGDTTKANPKYYRLRFAGQGLSLSYMITEARIVDHVNEVLPVVQPGEGGEIIAAVDTVAEFTSHGDFVGWEQDNPNIPKIKGVLPATAEAAKNKAVELKIDVKKLEGTKGFTALMWGMAGAETDWSQGDTWWADNDGAVSVTEPGTYIVRFSLDGFNKAKSALVTSHLRFRVAGKEDEVGAKVTMKIYDAEIVDIPSETEPGNTGDDLEVPEEYKKQTTAKDKYGNDMIIDEYGPGLSELTGYSDDLSGKKLSVNVSIEGFKETKEGVTPQVILIMASGDNWGLWTQVEKNITSNEKEYTLELPFDAAKNFDRYRLRFIGDGLTVVYKIGTFTITGGGE